MRRLVLVSVMALAAACDEGRERPPFTPSPARDGGPSDGAVRVDGGGVTPGDGGSDPAAPEVDPRCIDGMYTEALPDTAASLAAPIAAYSAADPIAFIQTVLDLRYPTGAYLVRGGLMNTAQGHCVDLFLRNRTMASGVLRELGTIVHECGHFYDIAQNGRYHITPATSFACSRGDTVARRGRTFARSLLNGDAFSMRRPPCNSAGGDCDSYADIYLDGDPTDGTFESGDQGFNSVLEETVQYVNSLATGYAFADQLPRGTRVSERDGILTFLWYVGRYLRMARLEHPDAYALLSGDDCWRRAILTTWGRAWLMLEATENMPSLGIDDDALIALVRDPEILGEIARLRQAAGCP